MERKQSESGSSAADARGAKTFAAFDYALRVVWITLTVLGVGLLIIALSGVDMAALDEHEVFRYRTQAAVAVIALCLIADHVFRRRRKRLADAEALTADAAARGDFVLSVDPDADQRAVETAAAISGAREVARDRSRYRFRAALIAAAFMAAGGAAFWHDHITHDIPNAVAVPAAFVEAKCHGRGRIGAGPYMAVGYQFVSRSTTPRSSGMTCLLDKCEPEKAPAPVLDTEYKRVAYATLAACEAALPAVRAARAATTVWTGDKDPNAAVRARFTPEREQPPYFLLWLPAVVGGVVLLVLVTTRRSR